MHFRFKNQNIQSFSILLILLNIGLLLIDDFDFENDHTFDIFILNYNSQQGCELLFQFFKLKLQMFPINYEI